MAESMMFYRIVAANSINKMFNEETGKEEYTIEEYPHVYDNYEDAYEDAFKWVGTILSRKLMSFLETNMKIISKEIKL